MVEGSGQGRTKKPAKLLHPGLSCEQIYAAMAIMDDHYLFSLYVLMDEVVVLLKWNFM